MPDSCAAFGCTYQGQLLLYNFIPSVKWYPEQRLKWVTAMRRENGQLRKKNNEQICSVHFATDKPSSFSKSWIFPTIYSFSLC